MANETLNTVIGKIDQAIARKQAQRMEWWRELCGLPTTATDAEIIEAWDEYEFENWEDTAQDAADTAYVKALGDLRLQLTKP